MSAGSQIFPGTRRRAPRHAHHRARQRRGPAFAFVLLGAAVLGAWSFSRVAGMGTASTPPGRTAAALAFGEAKPGAVDPTPGAGPAAAGETTGEFPVAPGACRAPAAPLPTPAIVAHPGAVASFVPDRAPIHRPLAVFVGDSYTSGYLGTGEGADGWPAIVSGSRGWRMVNLAEPGVGFVNPGWTAPLRAQVSAAAELKPDLVILAGGHNDEHYGTDRTARAADAVLDGLSDALPGSLLVVIGPIWYDGSPVPTILALRDHLRARAAAMGALFIDPIAGGWFAGSNHQRIGADGVHPTNAGHHYIAGLVLAALGADPRFAPATVKGPTETPTAIDDFSERVGRASGVARCAG